MTANFDVYCIIIVSTQHIFLYPIQVIVIYRNQAIPMAQICRIFLARLVQSHIKSCVKMDCAFSIADAMANYNAEFSFDPITFKQRLYQMFSLIFRIVRIRRFFSFFSSYALNDAMMVVNQCKMSANQWLKRCIWTWLLLHG